VTGIGDHTLVPELADQGAAPPRVAADLEYHEAGLANCEELVKRPACRGNLGPAQDRALAVEEAQVTGAISEVASDSA